MMRTAKKQITTEKENGRFYTPPFLVDIILDLSEYKGENILKKHVIENSCGDGAFLTAIVKRYCEEATKAGLSGEEIRLDLGNFIHAIEIENAEKNKCVENVDRVVNSFGIEDVNWDINCGNTLNIDKYNGKMDFVLGNPPYVRVHNLGESANDVKSFLFAQGGMTDLFIVFYEIGLKMLNNNGVLGYITPSSFFSSLAGNVMRKCFVSKNYIEKVLDLKHFQAFNATTYNAIVVLKKNNDKKAIDYYELDNSTRKPVFVDALTLNDCYIAGNFYFSKKENLQTVKKIYGNMGRSSIEVKNGYATLCDDVFINDFDFESQYIIPVIKSSRGIKQKILYPYDKDAKLVDLETIKQDSNVYNYLLQNKEKLIKRSNENSNEDAWYAFGRSQAISDTYHDKIAVNSLLRSPDDFKFVFAPAGVGVYSGLYIISDDIPADEIMKTLKSEEFFSYVSMLGKYKSGGYYTFSSKDVKVFLDYKFAYNGGLFGCGTTNNS